MHLFSFPLNFTIHVFKMCLLSTNHSTQAYKAETKRSSLIDLRRSSVSCKLLNPLFWELDKKLWLPKPRELTVSVQRAKKNVLDGVFE